MPGGQPRFLRARGAIWGTVAEVGPDVTAFAVGDEVLGFVDTRSSTPSWWSLTSTSSWRVHHPWLTSHGVIPVLYGDGVIDRIKEASGGHWTPSLTPDRTGGRGGPMSRLWDAGPGEGPPSRPLRRPSGLWGADARRVEEAPDEMSEPRVPEEELGAPGPPHRRQELPVDHSGRQVGDAPSGTGRNRVRGGRRARL
jgi:hypothetical protein